MTDQDYSSVTARHEFDADHTLEMLGLTTTELEGIRDFGRAHPEIINESMAEFYIWMSTTPWYHQYFSDENVLRHVQDKQLQHWERAFGGTIDDDYVFSRRAIGEAHARIGLPLTAYFAGSHMFQRIFTQRLRDNSASQELLQAFSAIVAFDTAIVVDTYNEIVESMLTEQADSMMAMSTPVAEIWDGVLFLPIVGLIDSHRAREIMNSTLAKISETQARVFVLDISGVAVVDTAVANNLFRVTKATRLMGCESIISGLSPSIAQTIVDLGIEVGRLRTTSTMRDAIALAFQRVGIEISEHT